MNVFELRERLINDYSSYIRSFIRIRDERIEGLVSSYLEEGLLWPDPLIQLNPSFQYAGTIDDLVAEGLLHGECSRVFRAGKDKGDGKPLRLYQHQADAVRRARASRNYVLTTGTGSGKSLAYIIPIVDHVLRNGTGRGIQAIVVYPMNALANSQFGELQKFLQLGYPDGKGPVTFARYTGQERDEERNIIVAKPPDILLTNYVMLELILTRVYEKQLVKAAQGLRFLVLDELHTYRGRQGADVALLVRRAREFFGATKLQVVGTSATLAGPGTYDQQQAEVADVATVLFGAEVAPADVIGETLQRATPEENIKDSGYLASLRKRVEDQSAKSPLTYKAFTADPLSSWIEGTFGIYRDSTSGRLRRRRSRTITGKDGAASELSRLAGVDDQRAKAAIQEALLAGYTCERNPETGFPAFAFRLHQFISRGDTVYASLESEDKRYLTFNRQQYVPGDRGKILLPMVFCRECGQEYYCARRLEDSDSGTVTYVQRELSDRGAGDGSKLGFLHFSSEAPWPSGTEEELSKLPDDWVEDTNQGPRVKPTRKKNLPRPITVSPDGRERLEGLNGHFLESPFRFCLRCRVSYDFRTTSDFGKLTSLGTEGRSTATTILSLATIRHLRMEQSLEPRARKLLSFTDNRQDASLQAGHFNDFIEIGLLRSALLKACSGANPDGLTHEVFTQRVFDALGLPFAGYSKDPDLSFRQSFRRSERFVMLLGTASITTFAAAGV